MKIAIKQSILARKLDKDFNDEGVFPLSVGKYDIAGDADRGYLPVKVPGGLTVFIPTDRLEEQIDLGIAVINSSERH